MQVGTEWIVDASGCDAEALRSSKRIIEVSQQLIKDLQLKPLGEQQWHIFGGEGGVTGLIMLTESHIACHTYPEVGIATFNLYCCRTRPEWNWHENLSRMIGAKQVNISKIERGAHYSVEKAQFGSGGMR